MDKHSLKTLTVLPDKSLIDVLRQMDKARRKLLIVADNKNTFHGLVTVGDIQRSIINNIPLTHSVSEIIRADLIVATPENTPHDIKETMLKHRMEFCPVVDKEQNIVHVVFWEDLFRTKQELPKTQFELPVVIMAGGFGTRLKPITNVLPKPLLPINDKSMLEEIMLRFHAHGVNDFRISINYKSELIEYYLSSLGVQPWKHTCFLEQSPLGTAGSLSMLRETLHTTFFVTNCDILVDEEYDKILNYHREQENEITAVATLKNFSLPYGTLKTAEGGRLLEISEKPSFTFKLNSGMYILEPHLLNEIPPGTFYNITDLIQKVLARNGRAGVFPVSEGAWTDVGDWTEYLKHIYAHNAIQRS